MLLVSKGSTVLWEALSKLMCKSFSHAPHVPLSLCVFKIWRPWIFKGVVHLMIQAAAKVYRSTPPSLKLKPSCKRAAYFGCPDTVVAAPAAQIAAFLVPASWAGMGKEAKRKPTVVLTVHFTKQWGREWMPRLKCKYISNSSIVSIACSYFSARERFFLCMLGLRHLAPWSKGGLHKLQLGNTHSFYPNQNTSHVLQIIAPCKYKLHFVSRVYA